MIRSKPIDDITYEDVRDFCSKGLSEGIYLDYKENFPSGLEKTIAAMANTYGGMILIGVADENDKPKPPFNGMEYKDDLRAKVENIVHDNIEPPFLVEVANCHDETKQNTFVVIRVPPSVSTPHALRKGPIYVRTGQSNQPENIASMEQISWLNERRKRTLCVKEELIERSTTRFETFLTEISMPTSTPALTLCACPSFPDRALFDYRKSNDLLMQCAKSGLKIEYGKSRSAAGGSVNSNYRGVPENFFYTELDEHGLLVFRTTPSIGTELNKLRYDWLVTTTIQFLVALKRLYTSIGYRGYTDFSLAINQVALKIADTTTQNYAWGDLGQQQILDNKIFISKQFSVPGLIENFEAISTEILGRLSFACGMDKADDDFHVDAMKRLVPN